MIGELPSTLRTDVLMFMNEKMIEEVPLFINTPQRFKQVITIFFNA